MATRFLNKGPIGAGTGNAHGFSADDNDVLVHDNGSTQGTVAVQRVKILTASYTATEADNGTIFVADSATSVVVSLPATRAGLTFTLVVGTLTTSGGHAIDPVAADQVIGNGFTPSDGAAVTCTAASDRLGDAITVVADGVDGWFVTSVTGTWANS